MARLVPVLVLVVFVGCRPTVPEVKPASTRVTPFLMYQGGVARQAMDLYVSLFPGSEIEEMELYGPEGPGPEGTVKLAAIRIAGQRILCIDSPAPHEFDFTPSTSLFVDCTSEEELERLFEKLSEEGQVMMPPGDYGFSRRFTWCADRFGVSWQINLPH